MDAAAKMRAAEMGLENMRDAQARAKIGENPDALAIYEQQRAVKELAAQEKRAGAEAKKRSHDEQEAARKKKKEDEEAIKRQQALGTAFEGVVSTFQAYKAGTMGLLASSSNVAFETLTISIDILKAAIGRGLIHAAMQASKWLQELADWVNSLDDDLKTSIGNWVAVGIAVLGAAAALKTLLFLFSPVVAGVRMLYAAFLMLKAVNWSAGIQGLIVDLQALGAVLMAHPIMLLAGILTAAGAAAYYLSGGFASVQNVADNLANRIQHLHQMLARLASGMPVTKEDVEKQLSKEERAEFREAASRGPEAQKKFWEKFHGRANKEFAAAPSGLETEGGVEFARRQLNTWNNLGLWGTGSISATGERISGRMDKYVNAMKMVGVSDPEKDPMMSALFNHIHGGLGNVKMSEDKRLRMAATIIMALGDSAKNMVKDIPQADINNAIESVRAMRETPYGRMKLAEQAKKQGGIDLDKIGPDGKKPSADKKHSADKTPFATARDHSMQPQYFNTFAQARHAVEMKAVQLDPIHAKQLAAQLENNRLALERNARLKRLDEAFRSLRTVGRDD